jgi:hypothetical protein
MTEDLITALSKVGWLFVATRASSFACKGEALGTAAHHSQWRVEDARERAYGSCCAAPGTATARDRRLCALLFAYRTHFFLDYNSKQ